MRHESTKCLGGSGRRRSWHRPTGKRVGSPPYSHISCQKTKSSLKIKPARTVEGADTWGSARPPLRGGEQGGIGVIMA